MVTDAVSGTVYRPDGTVLAFDPAQAAPRISSGGLNLTRIGELFGAQFAGVAAEHGFRKVGYHFVRGIEGGWQGLAPRVREIDGVVLADVAVDVYNYEDDKRSG